ncbi:MAG: glycosyltransferase, partial [Lentimicrobium sp.]|nr:glycosyltransferase [Lentimicrobium sp.]
MNFELTIIIPVFNEEGNLERVRDEMNKFLKIAKKKTKILFVNDGSKDNSQSLIEKI